AGTGYSCTTDCWDCALSNEVSINSSNTLRPIPFFMILTTSTSFKSTHRPDWTRLYRDTWILPSLRRYTSNQQQSGLERPCYASSDGVWNYTRHRRAGRGYGPHWFP